VALDEIAVLAIPDYVAPEETLPSARPRISTLPPSLETDLRLIRLEVNQQSQLLATMHQVMVTGQQVVGEQLQRFSAELEAQTVKIDRMAEMVTALFERIETA